MHITSTNFSGLPSYIGIYGNKVDGEPQVTQNMKESTKVPMMDSTVQI